MDLLSWMAWTTPVAVFFICIAVMLASMTIWELHSPSVPRKGLLPMITTRGDRLFIGLLAAAFANLAWAGGTELAQWYGAVLGGLLLLAIMKWG